MALTCARRADFAAESAFPLVGRVGTVFRRAVDVPCGEILLTMMTEEAYLHPLAIRIDESLFARLEPGMSVVADARGLRIGRSESVWSNPLQAPALIERQLSVAREAELAATIRRVLSISGKRSHVGEAFLDGETTEFLEPVVRLREALGRGTSDLAAVERWFGGGAGLTPAWDDFCCGALLADRFFGGGLIAPASHLIERLSVKTTIQSTWQLRFAERGRSSLLVERFLASLADGTSRSADVLRIAGIGHTSGTDLLAGMCLRLEAGTARSHSPAAGTGEERSAVQNVDRAPEPS